MKLTTSPRLLAFSLFLALPASLAVAQGSPVRVVSEEIHQYLSPMVLELDLSASLELPPDKAWTTDAAKRFVCRGVTIESLSLVASAASDDPRRVAVRVLIANTSGKDKRVQLFFANGERGKEQSMGTFIQKVSPDERKRLVGTLLLLPSEAWVHQPRPTVRLTVTADDY